MKCGVDGDIRFSCIRHTRRGSKRHISHRLSAREQGVSTQVCFALAITCVSITGGVEDSRYRLAIQSCSEKGDRIGSADDLGRRVQERCVSVVQTIHVWELQRNTLKKMLQHT